MLKLTLCGVFMLILAVLKAQDWPQDGQESGTNTEANWDNSCNFTTTPSCDPEAHQMHCHDTSYEHIHLCVGESIAIPNKCLQMTCVHYDGNVVMYRGCSNIVPNEGCYLTEQDDNLLFPDCCPKEICYEPDSKKKK